MKLLYAIVAGVIGVAWVTFTVVAIVQLAKDKQERDDLQRERVDWQLRLVQQQADLSAMFKALTTDQEKRLKDQISFLTMYRDYESCTCMSSGLGEIAREIMEARRLGVSEAQAHKDYDDRFKPRHFTPDFVNRANHLRMEKEGGLGRTTPKEPP